MPLLPADVVHASVAAEIAAARAWARRHGYPFKFDKNRLTLDVTLSTVGGDAPQERYLLKGTFEDYRAIPPCWWMAHPKTGADVGPPAYPRSPDGRSGLFINFGPTGAMICAHFNRLAFAHNGPHPEWGEDAINWLNVGAEANARAETIADMLARIALDVCESPGRMAPLP